MDFDTLIDRRGTDCAKWDFMEKIYGVPAENGLPMWVADTDFQVADVIRCRLRDAVDHGVFGYVNMSEEYNSAIQWWMKTRHNWDIEADWIFTTTGLINAVGLALDTFTEKGDQIILFTPVYHAFAKIIKAAGREVAEFPLTLENDRYVMDFDAYDDMIDGRQKMAILCSPHNPGGRIWEGDELRDLAAFCARHDLMLISDDIHHDLVYPGHSYTPMPLAAPEATDRLLMLTAPSKTFNLAGLHTGNVIIPDAKLRARFSRRVSEIGLAGNSLGQMALAAAYTPEGADWVDAQMAYLDENRKLFDACIADIPGATSMPLQATYLSWVDFSGTGLGEQDFLRRIEQDARIAVNHGSTFGKGGETFARFNIGTQRSRVEEACTRLRTAFADLQ